MGDQGRVGERQMPLVEKLVFASADIFGGGGAALLNVGYFFFLSDLVGLGPGLAGFVFGCGKVWDAVARPIVGRLSDNTRTRWGRRRPFLIVGGLLIMVGTGLLWLPTGGWTSTVGKTMFALASCLLYSTITVVVTTPYASLSTETTTDYAERNRVNILRLVFSNLAAALITLATTQLVTAYRHGSLSSQALYVVFAFGFGALFVVPVVAAGVIIRERTPVPAARTGFSPRAFLAPLEVPAFRSLLGLYLCATLMLDVVTTQLLAYTTYAVHVNSTLFMAVVIVINFVGFAVTNRLLTKISKNTIYRTLLPLAVLAAIAVAAWPSSWAAWPIYVVAAVFAVGIAGSQQMPWVMFPDVVDAAEIQQGRRDGGTLAGLMSLTRSLCSAVMIFVIGLVLQASGYRAGVAGDGQPESAVLALRLVIGLAVAGFSVLGWVLARRYPITREVATAQQRRVQRIRDEAANPGTGVNG